MPWNAPGSVIARGREQQEFHGGGGSGFAADGEYRTDLRVRRDFRARAAEKFRPATGRIARRREAGPTRRRRPARPSGIVVPHAALVALDAGSGRRLRGRTAGVPGGQARGYARHPMAGPAGAQSEDMLLRALAEAVEAEVGDLFFRSLVRHLAGSLGVQYAFVSELTRGGTHFRTLALWARGGFAENVEIPLDGTPCEAVLEGRSAHHADRLQQCFPRDTGLVDWDAASYAGVPMLDSAGRVVGHFAVIDDRAMPDATRALGVMRIFAARAVAELERKRALDALRASEQRLEQIVASAADGIIVSDVAGTIVVFNPGAERILRCTAAEAIGRSVYDFGVEEGVAGRQAAIDALRKEPSRLFFYGEGEGVLAKRADGSLFLQEGSLSHSEVDGRELVTVIFRDVEERRGAGLELVEVQRHNEYLQEELRSVYNFKEIVGRSPALARVFAGIERVAGTDASVLICGETGTGKELIARAIHARSPRKDRPLVKVNCAALSPGLVESELFGHEKGAFTGATERRIGRFELADGGTIFLDEVGEIPLEIQVKLLRVLQEREFERAGGSATLRTDVRVIAATNRDLSRAIADGKFREDLFYRLNVFPLVMPALRDRVGDIPLLVSYFVDRHQAKLGRRITHVADATMQRLARYAWPGNVRELENVIERAVILARGPELEVGPGVLGEDRAHVAPMAAQGRGPEPSAASDARLAEVERRHITETLQATGWRVEGPTGAARRLGLNASTLRSRIKKLGISRSRDEVS